MKRFFGLVALTLVAGALLPGRAGAQPVLPEDTVALESKTIIPADSGCGKVALRIRVSIANRDSLGNITLVFVERTVPSYTAYATLSRRAPGCQRALVGDVFNVLYPNGPGGGARLPTRSANFLNYHSNSPDSFLAAFTLDDPANDDGKMPPNQNLTLLGEIKFDSVRGQGLFELDSVRILGNTLVFVDLGGTAQKPNFKLSRDSVPPITDVQDIHRGVIPKEYTLSQNYPNPFNANTQISFALPKAGKTTLEIFNVLGQKVSTLINEYLTAGTKTVNWDGRDDNGVGVPSGIYFYRLSSFDFKETKKMIVIK